MGDPNIVLKTTLFAEGWTQRALSLATGISEQAISGFVRGRVNPRGDERERIASVLGRRIEELFPQAEGKVDE